MPHDPVRVADTRAWLSMAGTDLRAGAHELLADTPEGHPARLTITAQGLAAALTVGPTVTEAWIVSGPAREEGWRCLVGDRLGRTFVVTIGLDGTLFGSRRRVLAHVEV